MGRVLQIGVMLASLVVLAGGVMLLLARWSAKPQYGRFEPGTRQVSLLNPEPLLHGLAHANADAVIQLGMLLLIATPIARVVCALVGFSLEKDRLYIGVSATVLAILIWGMLRGG